MATLNRDEFFKTLSDLVGDKSDPDSIKALEDMTDTYNALENGVTGDGVDWKQKYEENDKSWRAKYRNRFLNGDGGNGPGKAKTDSDSDSYDPNRVGFNDLFKKA